MKRVKEGVMSMAVIVMLGGWGMKAEAKDVASLLQAADSVFALKEWERAASLYEAVTEQDSANGNGWYGLAVASHYAGDWERALEAYEKAAQHGRSPLISQYNMACIYSVRKDTSKAIEMLYRVIDGGYPTANYLKNDSDLAAVRAHKEYEQLLHRADSAMSPCEYNPQCRVFDFWVGDWEVRTTSGGVAGHNRIEKTLDGCLLIENWESVSGGTGKSVNYYDPSVGKWVQNWVDSRGNVIHYVGGMEEGSMKFEGYNYAPDGSRERSRMSFTPMEEGKVRQLIEQSTDEGKSWYIWFEGIYSPVKK
ncbi:MAG: tetratricopeptide repeat protein [Candidatus Zixiibacteriota bacterium]